MNLPFIDREKDISSLDKWYSKKGFALCVLYGRRRVGKTYLLKRFMEGKRGVYFLCDKAGTERNAIRLKKQIAEHLGDHPIESNDLDDIFSNLTKRITGRAFMVLDEFPYLIEKDDSIPSVFQRIVDETLAGSNIMLVLCGSSISMMEEGVLSAKSPLYGRRTGHRRIDPIPFTNISDLLKKYDPVSLVEIHASLGAIPYHLCMVDDSRSVKENLTSQLMTKDGSLYEEVDFLLRQELRDPDVYKSIVTTISAGNNRLIDISDKVGIPKGDLPKYLGKLIKLGILQKENSVTDEKKSRAIYQVHDNLFHFWFTFCEPFKSDLEISDLRIPLNNFDKKFDAFVGRRFEVLVREEFLRRILPFSPSRIGRYWSGEDEIDVVAIDQSGKRAAFVEIKWSNADPERELKELERKVERFPWNFEKRDLYLIARDLKRDHPSCFDLDRLLEESRK